MKNKILKISLVMLVVCTTFFGFSLINAADVSIVATGYTHTGRASGAGGSGVQFTNQSIDQLKVDGELGFCVEPWEVATDIGNYTPNEYTNDQLAKIVYHGYQNTEQSGYDYVVTQLIVWEILGYTPTSHNVPAFEARKQEILDGVNNHNVKPSFDGATITLNKDESITLVDSNNIFQNMILHENDSGISLVRNGNSLTIKNDSEVSENGNIKFRKIEDQNAMGASILFNHPTSQDIAVIRLSDLVEININVKVTNGKLNFNKTGEVFMRALTGSNELGSFSEPLWEKQELLGAKITIAAAEQINDHSGNKIYDMDQVINEVESTVENDYSIDLPQGKYYWWESKVPHGYIEDLNKTYFEVSADGGNNQIINADLNNERAQQIFVFNKTLENHDVEKYANEQSFLDVSFGVFSKEQIYDYTGNVAIEPDTMIAPFIIDKAGEAKASKAWTDINADEIIQNDELVYNDLKLDLPNGMYYVKELSTNPAYQLDAKEYPFTVSYFEQGMQNIALQVNNGASLVNELKDFKIKVNKVDSTTKKAIKSKDFAFTMYTDESCVDVYKEVNANVSEGDATFEGIHFGEYWIKETSAPEGYALSKEVNHLQINEEGVFVDGNQVTGENNLYSFFYFNEKISPVSAGDETNKGVLLTLLVFSGVALIYIYLNKRRKKSRYVCARPNKVYY